MYSDPTGYDAESSKKGYELMKLIYKTYPGFIKNTKTFKTIFGDRIPDFINDFVIGEIKNVGYQYLSSQIKGFMEIAKDEGKIFVLMINKTATLSRRLEQTITETGGKIIKVGSDGLKTRITPFFIYSRKKLEMYMKSFSANET